MFPPSTTRALHHTPLFSRADQSSTAQASVHHMQMPTPFDRDLSAPDAPVASSASAEGHPAAGLGRPAEQVIMPSGYISQWVSSVPPFYRGASPDMGIAVLEPEPRYVRFHSHLSCLMPIQPPATNIHISRERIP